MAWTHGREVTAPCHHTTDDKFYEPRDRCRVLLNVLFFDVVHVTLAAMFCYQWWDNAREEPSLATTLRIAPSPCSGRDCLRSDHVSDVLFDFADGVGSWQGGNSPLPPRR